MRVIKEDIERINETITFIGDVSTGNLDEVERFDIAELVRKQAKIFASQSVGIEVTHQAPANQEAITNPTTVAHVLSNLLKNSIEAVRDLDGARRGTVIVRLNKSAAKHIIEVEDNADGIPPEVEKKLFMQFRTKKTGGLGIGLYYCRTILEAQGGKITYETTRGKGTRFIVTLPDRG
jgi:two-component system sensor kinase FixL